MPVSDQPIMWLWFSAFRRVDVAKTTRWSSKPASEICRKGAFYWLWTWWTWLLVLNELLWSPGIFTTSQPLGGLSQKDKLSSEQQLRALECLVDVRGQRRLVRPAGDHTKSTGTQKTWVQTMSLNIPHKRKRWTQLEDLFSWTWGLMFAG